MGACSSSNRSQSEGAATPKHVPRDSDGNVDLLECLQPGARAKLSSETGPLPCLLISRVLNKEPAFADKAVTKDGREADLQAFGKHVGVVCKKGRKTLVDTPNQDHFLLAQAAESVVYGVFDGHGPLGHDVASFAAAKVLQHLARNPTLKVNVEAAMKVAFLKVQGDLALRTSLKSLDCHRSGTTATVLIDLWPSNGVGSRKLAVAHVGDSRAVVGIFKPGKTSSPSNWIAQDLTDDHKPGNPGELERIVAAGGVVRKSDGTDRVFKKGLNAPGLAMSRSLGDIMASEAGVSSVPDTKVLKVNDDWGMVLLCSDGVWEFVSSQEAVDIAAPFMPLKAQEAADALAAEALKRYSDQEPNNIDDITVVCISLGLNRPVSLPKRRFGTF